MIGPRPCAYANAYVNINVNTVFTSQSYDKHTHKHKKNELVRFSCVYAYASLAYTCPCAYAYELVKTGLKCPIARKIRISTGN